MLSQEQIELRRLGVYGSDASSLMGKNRYKSKHTLWSEKSGLVSDQVPQNIKMRLGHLTEPLNKSLYEEETGRWVATSDTTLFHPKYPFLGAHLDGMSIAPNTESEVIGVEFKSVFETQEYLWGDAWSDKIPINYAYQVMHYGLVTGITHWHVARLNMRDGSHCIHEIKFRDIDLGVYCSEACDFWRMVQENDPPPVDGSASTTETVRKMYPRPTAGKTRVFNKTWQKLASRVTRKKTKLDKAQADLDKVKNLVRLKMKDVEVVVDTEGKECITNKANKKGQRTLRFSRTGG